MQHFDEFFDANLTKYDHNEFFDANLKKICSNILTNFLMQI